MCSLSNRTSSSCRPTMFFFGHESSFSLYNCQKMSISALADGLLCDLRLFQNPLQFVHYSWSDEHCVDLSKAFRDQSKARLTLFANQRVVPVVRVVRIPYPACSSSAFLPSNDHQKLTIGVFELEKLVSVHALMTGTRLLSALTTAPEQEAD